MSEKEVVPKEDQEVSKKIDQLTIIEIIKKYPNDLELGREVRKYVGNLKERNGR